MSWPASQPLVNAVLRAGERWIAAIDDLNGALAAQSDDAVEAVGVVNETEVALIEALRAFIAEGVVETRVIAKEKGD